jgi:hypothetical protein
MNSMVDSLFEQYDRGRMTRRHLVQALAAFVLLTSTLAQETASCRTAKREIRIRPITGGSTVNLRDPDGFFVQISSKDGR